MINIQPNFGDIYKDIYNQMKLIYISFFEL